MATWQLQTAKAKLSELLRAVRDEGPQIISVRGKEEYVIALKQPAATPSATRSSGVERPRTILDAFAPVVGIGVELKLPPRLPEPPRLLWWEEALAPAKTRGRAKKGRRRG